MGDLLEKIISIVIGLIFIGSFLPTALIYLTDFNSSNSTVQSLVTTVLPVIGIISITILFIANKRLNLENFMKNYQD